MRTATLLLSLATVVGVLFVYLSVDGLRRSIESRPEIVTLENGPDGPLELVMPQPADPCPILKKKVGEGDDVYEVEFPCCRQDGETVQEWGARCRAEFAAFCEGLEGG